MIFIFILGFKIILYAAFRANCIIYVVINLENGNGIH